MSKLKGCLFYDGEFKMNKIIQLLNTQQYKDALKSVEKEIYLSAYNFTGGNQAATARLLGVARGTFLTKMKHWGKL